MVSRSRTRDEASPILRCIEERGKKAFCIADILGGYKTYTIRSAGWMLPADMIHICRQVLARMAQAASLAKKAQQALVMLQSRLGALCVGGVLGLGLGVHGVIWSAQT